MDKFSAIWLSHSSIKSFRACPRAYYLSYVYRDPRSGHKLSLVNPHLSLGSAVHAVLESIATLPTNERFKTSLVERLQTVWPRYAGRRGGFIDEESEHNFKARGQEMLQRVMAHPGPLADKAVKINQDLPNYWLSEADGLVICGRLDWLRYLPSSDSVEIIDFKTGASDEPVNSLQLPIYLLLASHCQTREVTRASYWYLSRDDTPREQKLPDLNTSHSLVLKAGKEIKLARSLERFKCPHSGCPVCSPYEKILEGNAEYVGEGEHHTDLYAVFDNSALPTSVIL